MLSKYNSNIFNYQYECARVQNIRKNKCKTNDVSSAIQWKMRGKQTKQIAKRANGKKSLKKKK